MKFAKHLKALFFTEHLWWLLFKTCNSNNLFKYFSVISLTNSKYLITCNSNSDKIIWKCIHLSKICSDGALTNLEQTERDLSDCNGTQTHNHLIRKQTLKHLTKLAKRLSCIVSTYLYGDFDYMFLSYHVCIYEWMHTLYLPECRGTPCSKQARYLKFKWLQRDSNPQPLSS